MKNQYTYHEATPYQKGEYLKHKYNKRELGANNISLSQKVNKLDITYFEKAYFFIINRHEIFRTSLILIKRKIYQKVWPFNESKYKIQYSDFSKLNDWETQLFEIERKANQIIFQPSLHPWINCNLIKLSASNYYFIITIPHIISDSESIKVLLEELSIAYQCIKHEQPVTLSFPYQFGEYTDTWVESIKSKGDRHKKFWRKTFFELPQVNLSTKYSRVQIDRCNSYKTHIYKELEIEFGELSYEEKDSFLGNVSYLIPKDGYFIDFVIHSDNIEILKEICRITNVKMQLVIIASFILLNLKLTGENSALIGINTNLRDTDNLKDVMGCLINTVILKHTIEKNQMFIEFIENVNTTLIRALRHKIYNFDQALKDSDISIDQLGGLFLNIIAKDDINSNASQHSNFILSEEKCHPYFDLDLHIYIYNNLISFRCHYKNDLFQASTIEFIFSEYLKLITGLKDFVNLKIEL